MRHTWRRTVEEHMARLRMTIEGEISLRLDGQELLIGCETQGRQLLKVLAEKYQGQTVSFRQLERENALTCTVSTALKYLLDTVWPQTEPGAKREMVDVIYTLPYDVSEEAALLCLKRVSKSELLLRLKRDHPDVWVDAWINAEKGRLSDSSNPLPVQLTSF